MGKNCMFQYATNSQIIRDTGLITRKEAKELFDSNKDDFIDRLSKGENPEMAIWGGCKDSSDYKETLEHWCSDDIKLIDGVIYKRVE